MEPTHITHRPLQSRLILSANLLAHKVHKRPVGSTVVELVQHRFAFLEKIERLYLSPIRGEILPTQLDGIQFSLSCDGEKFRRLTMNELSAEFDWRLEFLNRKRPGAPAKPLPRLQEADANAGFVQLGSGSESSHAPAYDQHIVCFRGHGV